MVKMTLVYINTDQKVTNKPVFWLNLTSPTTQIDVFFGPQNRNTLEASVCLAPGVPRLDDGSALAQVQPVYPSIKC